MAGVVPSGVAFISQNYWSNSRVLVVCRGDRAYVVYRGTNIAFRSDYCGTRRSVSANVKCKKLRWGSGLVHSGFLRIVRETESFVHHSIRRHSTDVREIFFTGHSQGGAVAYLAAMTFLLRSGTRSPFAVYTFGQPRAGDAQFSRDAEFRLGAIYGRVVNARDLFVGTPLIRQGYDHTREFFHFGPDQLVTRRMQSCGQGWPFSLGGFKDHSMDNYLRLCVHNSPRHV